MRESKKTEKITNKNELLKVIKYLEKGFNFNSPLSNRLFDLLLVNNRSLGFYGFVLYDNNLITGAILTPLQLIKFNQTKFEYVINLSSWYMNKELRGIEAINFAKYVLNSLKDFIITDYTPNKSASAIFKYLGFTTMDSASSLVSILGCIPSMKKKQFCIINKISYANFKSFTNTKFHLMSVQDINFNKIKLRNTEVVVAGLIKKRFKRHFMGLSFYLPIYKILWNSNDYEFSKNWKSIYFEILKTYKCLFIECDFKPSDMPLSWDSIFFKSKTNQQSNYLIRSGNKGEYIAPIGSELSIDLI